MQIYLKDKKSLAYFGKEATHDYWDGHWKTDELEKQIRECKTDSIFTPMVKKYLPKGSVILEGGCGTGYLVHALDHQGYKGIGIDFAEKTIEAVRKAVPEINVQHGDVRNLPITDGQLDGYISGGVIEHFWDGYDAILAEMSRTIRKGGYLFLTFPYMSPLRRLKAGLKFYPYSEATREVGKKSTFYQFALEKKAVIQDLQAKDFQLVEEKPFDGVKGTKDEIKGLRGILNPIYNQKRFVMIKALLNRILSPHSGHCIMLVFRKN